MTRGEAFGLIMKSICMDPNESIQSTWDEKIYEVALYNNLTQKAWEDFDTSALIDRGELFVLVAK